MNLVREMVIHTVLIVFHKGGGCMGLMFGTPPSVFTSMLFGTYYIVVSLEDNAIKVASAERCQKQRTVILFHHMFCCARLCQNF